MLAGMRQKKEVTTHRTWQWACNMLDIGNSLQRSIEGANYGDVWNDDELYAIKEWYNRGMVLDFGNLGVLADRDTNSVSGLQGLN